MSLISKYSIASRLATFLRKNGDKVINGSCKLSLTTSALSLLNSLFWDLLDDGVHYAEDPSLQDCTAAEDVQFLYSFIKRTTTLKLFHGVQTLRIGVDLSCFSNLTVLELRKIPVHLIIGLTHLSEQLKALICFRSIYLLKELFASSMDGPDVIKTWTELKELNVSYNYLESLDQSLKSLPNIEVFDLSHNHIKNTDEIKVLKNLTFVNLSYNQLIHLPVFSTETCRRLTKLILRNNNLEDLDGLDCLFNLEDLDVAYNLLSEYHVLYPLEKLKSLKILNLEGNPLFFHNRHTVLVAAFINSGVLNRGLQLNGKLFAVPCVITSSIADLSNSNNFNHQTSINTVVGDAESTLGVPEPNNHMSRSPSILSDFDDNSVSSIASQSGTDQAPAMGIRNSKKFRRKSSTVKKHRIQREVRINEPEEQTEESTKHIAVIENVPSHIKTRQFMEERREQRGESWLIPDLPRRDIIGTPPKVPTNTPIVNSLITPLVTNADIAKKLTTCLASESSHSPDTATAPSLSSSLTKEMTEVLDIAERDDFELPVVEKERCGSRESDDIEILHLDDDGLLALTEQLSSNRDNLSDCDIYGHHNSVYSNNEDLDSEEESEDSIFFVESRGGSKTEAMTVTVGPKYIREKDVGGKRLEDLDLSTLISVHPTTIEEEGRTVNEIHLEFDTVKLSKQKRIYLMDNAESAIAMSKILQPFADAKTLQEVTLGALECLKCNSQFSKQAAHKILLKTKKAQYKIGVLSSGYDSKKEHPQEIAACPNCGNHILVEMENLPLPTVAMPTSSKKSSDHSPDVLSTGSASSGSFLASLFSSIKLSPIIKRKSIPNVQTEECQDSNIQKGASTSNTANLGMKSNADSVNLTADAPMRRNSSDITIISNPSQNSISMIPDPSLELDLNTIIERDSQASLSPTSSQDQTFSKISSHPKSDHPDKNCVPGSKVNQPNLESANGEDHDFYSLTESLADENNQLTVPNDILSSGSENYQSPHKSKSSSLHSEEIDESSLLISLLGEKTIITHNLFLQLDHRIKLHLEINVFGNEEEFEACLQTSIVPLSTGDEFEGLFVVSSEKLYIIKFLPHHSLRLQQNESVEKIIRIIHSCPCNHLKQVKVILGNQGLTLSCGASSHVYTLIIRDADICNSFSSLLSDFVHESRLKFGKVEFFSSTSETLKQMQNSVFSSTAKSGETPEVLLHLFGFWWISRIDEKDTTHPVCIIVTHKDIFICRILYKKQDSCSDLNTLSVYHYTVMDHQKISDLISLELKKDLKSVDINFLNELSHVVLQWTIKTETKSSLFSFINSVKNPWEEIFKVPLPLTKEAD